MWVWKKTFDAGAGSHLFEKGSAENAINVGSSRVGMVTVTGEPLSVGSLKRSIITTDAGILKGEHGL